MMATQPKCPLCTVSVEIGSKFFPFCSERCKLIDLGKWASGEYAVPAVEGADREDEEIEER